MFCENYIDPWRASKGESESGGEGEDGDGKGGEHGEVGTDIERDFERANFISLA